MKKLCVLLLLLSTHVMISVVIVTNNQPSSGEQASSKNIITTTPITQEQPKTKIVTIPSSSTQPATNIVITSDSSAKPTSKNQIIVTENVTPTTIAKHIITTSTGAIAPSRFLFTYQKCDTCGDAQCINYAKAECYLDAATAYDKPRIITSAEDLAYAALFDSVNDNYQKALSNFRSFYTTTWPAIHGTSNVPTVIDAATDQSNEIVSTIQHMIDLCINNLNWLSNDILDAVLDRQKGKVSEKKIITTTNVKSESTSPASSQETSNTQKDHKQFEISQTYIEAHKQLLTLGDDYENNWIKPTEKFVDKNWKPQLYDQFIARRDGLILYTTEQILLKLSDIASSILITDNEYDYARAVIIDAENRLKKYLSQAVQEQTVQLFLNTFNGLNGSTYDVKTIWDDLHGAYAWIAAKYAAKIEPQMHLELTLSDPYNADFSVEKEFGKLTNSDNPNIQKLRKITAYLQESEQAYDCLGCYISHDTVKCSCTDKEAVAGDYSALAAVIHGQLQTFMDLQTYINLALKQSDFMAKAMGVVKKGNSWLHAHLSATSSFLQGMFTMQQGREESAALRLPPLSMGNYDSQRTLLDTVQQDYSGAAYDFETMLDQMSTLFINGPIVPDRWIAYARDAQSLYAAITDMSMMLFPALKNIYNELENVQQLTDDKAIQSLWLKIIGYAQQFDQGMERVRSYDFYKVANPFPWYETKLPQGASKPFTAYIISQCAGPYWQKKIEPCGSDGCTDQQLRYILYAMALQDMYPYLSEDDKKKYNGMMSASAHRLLANAQSAFETAKNSDRVFEQERKEAESTSPIYQENPQALAVWETAVQAAHAALNFVADTDRPQALTLLFDCLHAYRDSNIVRMQSDYVLRQISITYQEYEAYKKWGNLGNEPAIIDRLKGLLTPLWTQFTGASKAYAQALGSLKTEDDYEKALANLKVLATLQALVTRMSDTPLFKVSGTTYSVPIVPDLKPITVSDENSAKAYADLYKRYGIFLLEQALNEHWDKEGNRIVPHEVTYAPGDREHNPEKIINQFMPLQLQKAAAAFNNARVSYQQAHIPLSSDELRNQLDNLNHWRGLAEDLFTIEVTSVEPVESTNEFNPYVPKDMAGKVYGQYVLPSWMIPIPDDVVGTYDVKDQSQYPDILMDTLLKNYSLEVTEDEKDAFRDALKTFMTTGTTTKNGNYKLSFFVVQPIPTENSYVLFVSNYPTLPMPAMNMLDVMTFITKEAPTTTLGIEAITIGINALSKYIDQIEKRLSLVADVPTTIKDFVKKRKNKLIELCRSAQLSAASILYNHAHTEAHTLLENAPGLSTIKSLDKDGLNYFEALSDSVVMYDRLNPSKNPFYNAFLCAASAQSPIANTVLSDEENQKFVVKTDDLQQFIMHAFITFLQQYLVGDPAADNYQAIATYVQGLFSDMAELFKSSQADSKSKDEFRAMYDQQVQQLLGSALFYEQKEDYSTASNNLFEVILLYDQYKMNLTNDQKTLAKNAGLLAIQDVFKVALEKFMDWYENRAHITDSACDPHKTNVYDALIFYGLLSSLSQQSTDQANKDQTTMDQCNQQQGEDRISLFRKIFGIAISCPLPGEFTLCKRLDAQGNAQDCTAQNKQFQSQALLDRVNPDVNNYLCLKLQKTCDDSLSAYVFNHYVVAKSPDSTMLRKFMAGFVEERLSFALQKSGNMITITGTGTDLDKKLAALQSWATSMLSMIFGVYTEDACKDVSDPHCRINELQNLTNALAARKTALTQSVAQLFRGSATITCS